MFTSAGETLAYDVLVIACGARAAEGLPGALTFRGEPDEAALRTVLDEVADGAVSSLVFAIPAGTTWPLPLYELALMSAAELEQRGRAGHTLMLVTPEQAPLEQFGGAASDAVATQLADAGIATRYGCKAIAVVDGELRLAPDSRVPADRVVAAPRLRGPAIAGLPSDPEGFVPTDEHGLVTEAVYAAGDATAFPVKQGGIAIQQADAVAEAVAARLGASIRPSPFRPLLRGILLTGERPRFLAADPAGNTSAATVQPLWWPPGKIAGGWLARFLHAEGIPVPPPPGGPGTMEVELELSGVT